jgi:HlyD family secretion protein
VKHIFISIILLAFTLSGCTKKKPIIITYDLKRSDYLETIDASGTIQPVNMVNLVAPRVNVSGLTVVYLAEDGAHVKKGDTICIIGAPELDNIIESFKTELEKLEGDLKKLEADNSMQLSMLNAQVETNNAQMAITMLDSVQMKFAPVVKQRLIALEMEKANIEKTKLRKKLIAQKRIDNSEVMQLRSRISMQKGRIDMYQNQAKSLKLAAPCDGVVMHYVAPEMRFLSSSGAGTFGGKIEEGSSVFANMTVLQIPDMKEMQVSVDVPEVDFKRIKEGQKAFITVDAVTDLHTTGKVKRKTLGGSNPREQTAIKTYQVVLSIDSCHSRINPGLSAMCRIIVDQVRDTIVVPAGAIFIRDSSKIIYVADGEKFIPVIVETGFSNISRTIISKGLAGDETIALMEPPHNLIVNAVKPKTDSIRKSQVSVKDSLVKSSITK